MENINDSYCLRCGIEIDFGHYCEICNRIILKKRNVVKGVYHDQRKKTNEKLY